MKNPFAGLWRRRRRESPSVQSPESIQPEGRRARLSPDGLQVVEFPPAYSSMLRLYGVSGTYSQIYASQPNVRTAVGAIAREAATLHAHVFEKHPRNDGPAADIHLDDHPVHVLLDTPSPGMSRYRFFYSLFADLAIYDIAYWLKIKQKNSVKALIRVPPASITPFRDPITGRVQYFRAGNGQIISPEELVIFWGYDPTTNEGMISPMETLRRLLSEEYAAGLDREGRWRNSARKDGVIERHVDSPQMSDEGKEGFLIDVEDSLTGPVGSGRPLMLQPGMTWKDFQWSPREMEYIEARKLSRTEVAAHFHMPPSMVAAASNGQEPNRETLNYFYTSTLPPWLVRVEREIEAQLVPEFELTPQRQRAVFVRFNLDEKLRGSFEERISILATAAGGPIITVNEARSREKLPPIPGGDLIFVPLNSVRAGGPQASPQSPVETPADGPEPAGTTPGGGTQPQASLADVEAGRTIVLGAQQASHVLDPSVSSIEDLIAKLDGRSALRKSQLDHLTFLREQFAKHSALGRQVFLKAFERQKNVLASGRDLKRDRWDRELSDDLYSFALPVAAKVAEDAAARLGTEYDAARADAEIKKQISTIAIRTNDESERAKDFSEARAEQLSERLTSWLMGWSTNEALRQSELTNGVKTWNSRCKLHEPVDSESVGSSDRFSNGALHPGDAFGAEEICTCLMTVGATE